MLLVHAYIHVITHTLYMYYYVTCLQIWLKKKYTMLLLYYLLGIAIWRGFLSGNSPTLKQLGQHKLVYSLAGADIIYRRVHVHTHTHTFSTLSFLQLSATRSGCGRRRETDWKPVKVLRKTTRSVSFLIVHFCGLNVYVNCFSYDS